MKTIEHFIDQQAAAEQEFMESFHREHRSFENPLVTVNPYGIAPLTAVIAFFTEEKVSVSITVKGMEAVSYTHLDVYKRQFLCRGQ